MTNTVSHRKVWMARIAGLFVLTALAAMYLAFPMVSMAVDPQNVNAQKPVAMNTKSFGVTFLGPVNSGIRSDLNLPAPSATGTMGNLNIMRFDTGAVKDVLKGEWVAVTVSDKTNNTKYPWMCTIFNVTLQGSSTKFDCVLGQAGNTKLTSPAAVQQLQGKLATFTLTPDADGKFTIQASDISGSGWSTGSVLVS